MLLRFLGVAGLFSWFAILLSNFTQDSFAIPNIWINLGVLVGMTAFELQDSALLSTPEPAAPPEP
jgi:hypothetical protein